MSPSHDTRPRRTFAVISHPDAGKSTLTEAMALHARVITEAGAVHGKAGRRGTVSDWMEMERARGISITSAALQFDYADHVVNLVDTPGHADFSEDTYRVLSAVDSAVMLVDAAKGLEPQTLKLFQVCAQRGIPVITVINKWDRPGLDPLQLMDEIQQKIRLRPTPLTWPVGVAGEFRGVLDRRTGDLIHYTRTAGGATRAPEERVSAADAEAIAGEAWVHAVEEHDLLTMDDADHDQATFLAGETTPVLFASALLNFGVAQLLDALVELAPPPRADARRRRARARRGRRLQRLRVQGAGRDGHRAPRPRRLRTGLLGRLRARDGGEPRRDRASRSPRSTPRPSSGASARRSTRPSPATSSVWSTRTPCGSGTRSTSTSPVRFPPIATFAPEHFAVARAADSGRYKQFRRGHRPARQRGRRPGAPLGPARRPVPGARRRRPDAVRGGRRPDGERVRGRRSGSTTLAYTQARRTDAAAVEALKGVRGVEVMSRADGTQLALVPGQVARGDGRPQPPGRAARAAAGQRRLT